MRGAGDLITFTHFCTGPDSAALFSRLAVESPFRPRLVLDAPRAVRALRTLVGKDRDDETGDLDLYITTI